MTEIVSEGIHRLIKFEDAFGEANIEVRELRLADGVVVTESAALAWTVTAGRLVVLDVVDQRRFQTIVVLSRIANRRLSWPHHTRQLTIWASYIFVQISGVALKKKPGTLGTYSVAKGKIFLEYLEFWTYCAFLNCKLIHTKIQ